MLTQRYLTSISNLPDIMKKIIEGTAPERFNREHLAGIGFAGSNDRAVIPLLKDLEFLTSEGVPTTRYHAYRDQSRSKAVMGEAVLVAYKDLFTINEKPTQKDRAAIEGKFKSTHNATDRVARQQAATFYALLKLADLDAARTSQSTSISPDESTSNDESPELLSNDENIMPPPKNEDEDTDSSSIPPPKPPAVELRYNIEVHLPPTKDIEVYNAIFKALKEHLLVD